MKLFIDTANTQEIRDAASIGVICGVTTNPTLVAKEGRDFSDVIQEIAEIVDGPISAEVMADDCNGMIAEARTLSKIHPNIVIKIPVTQEGLKAVHQLAKEGIRTNVTLIFSPSQALLAARAGASFVSPFVGRLNDISNDGITLIKTIADIFSLHNIKTEIIAASIRDPQSVVACAKAGAHIATLPYKVIQAMFVHPLTDAGIQKFKKDWNKK